MAKKSLFVSLMILALTTVAVSSQSCKATRAITTTSTCTICADSTKSTATIQTKTTEDYTGVRKN